MLTDGETGRKGISNELDKFRRIRRGEENGSDVSDTVVVRLTQRECSSVDGKPSWYSKNCVIIVTPKACALYRKKMNHMEDTHV